MARPRKPDFSEPSSIAGEEDEAALAAIDRGLRAAGEGRLVSREEARRRLQQGLS